jgi:hypothetical protein
MLLKSFIYFSFNPHWLRFNCHSEKSLQAGSGQRIIDIDTVPLDLSIESATIVGQNLHIKWNPGSNQDPTIIPIQFLVNNNPAFDPENYKKPNFKTCKELKFFDYRSFKDLNGTKNKQNVYL